MITKKSEDAVSPVIGIMLLVVVTVVIAAVITTFATGVVGSTEPAPVATLDVEILSTTYSQPGQKGPELFITHLSGEAVDTDDIELRFSWNCGVDGCTYGGTHYSTHSAEEMSKHIENGVLGKQCQPLYVKSTMEVQKENPKYGTRGGLNHYFGDVILTPGLKLTAHSEFLPGYDNTESPFMDVIFNNYRVITTVNEKAEKICQTEAYYTGHKMKANGEPEWDEDCPYCAEYYDPGYKCHVGWVDFLMNDDPYVIPNWNNVHGRSIQAGDCAVCAYKHDSLHPVAECSPEKGCGCAQSTGNYVTTYTPGIMQHLQPGTAVDIMIVHIPSGKAIYDKTVIVE